MRFTPVTEEQIHYSNLLPEGAYNYLVEKAEEKISAQGKSYLSLILKVWDEDGKEHTVFTNLALMKLLKHFCDVNNLQDKYNQGELYEADCVNKSGGKVMVGFEGEKPNGKGGMYKAKNIVKDYVVNELYNIIPAVITTTVTNNDFVDSEIPF